MPSVESPFQIAVADNAISLLRQKLSLTTLPSSPEDAGWDYGSPLPDMQRLLNKWQHSYDWRKHEAALNAELPQFTRDIEVEGFGSLNIHYVHKRSALEGAVPLMFVHGWPGSFFEVRKILPLLIQSSPEHPSFHVVALSLPGFGFSEAPTKKGFSIPQYAEVAHKLMLALGYDEYVTQGGDWGMLITRKMASLYGPKHVKAWHTNFPLTSPPSLSRPMLLLSHVFSGLPFMSYTAADNKSLERTNWYRTAGSAYFIQQSTQPLTIGYSFADSPAGLLGWLYEKLVRWTDNYEWTDDELLTWISIYWFSRAGPAASTFIYYEVVHSNPDVNVLAIDERTNVPVGHSYFPQELVSYPRNWYKSSNLVFEAEHESGGHFASYEKPEALVRDLRKMFGKGSKAFGVVKGKNGYAN